jgi:hypothetical protein
LDAKNKASDLAVFSERILGKAIKIVDSSSSFTPSPPIYFARAAFSDAP